MEPAAKGEPIAEPAVMEATFNDSAAIAAMNKKPTDATMLDPKDMEPFLPNKITDFRKLPGDYGWAVNNEASFSSVTCQYLGNKGGSFSMALFDYGSNANIIDEKYFHDLPEETGYVTSRISVKGGLAYKLWDSKKRSGKLRALLNNRFIITIDANMLPANSFGLEFLYGMIKTDELLRL